MQIFNVPEQEIFDSLPPGLHKHAANRLRVRDTRAGANLQLRSTDLVRFFTGSEEHFDIFAVLVNMYPFLKPGCIAPFTENTGLLTRPRLKGARWQEFNFEKVKFIEADFFESNMQKSNFENATFVNCRANVAVFERCNLRKATFTESTIKDSGFYASDLEGAKFTDVDARGADFTLCNIEGAKFSHIRLLDTKWWESKGTPAIDRREMNPRARASFNHRSLREDDLVEISSGIPEDINPIIAGRLTQADILRWQGHRYEVTQHGLSVLTAL